MIRVLLVEDEEMTMNLLKIIVNWEEFQMKIVGCASNGQAALFMIPEAKPDIVITGHQNANYGWIEIIRRNT